MYTEIRLVYNTGSQPVNLGYTLKALGKFQKNTMMSGLHPWPLDQNPGGRGQAQTVAFHKLPQVNKMSHQR